jgi:predicted transcriptional regulator YheO
VGDQKQKHLILPKKVAMAQSLYVNKNNTIDEICKTLDISRSTLYRYMNVEKKEV